MKDLRTFGIVGLIVGFWLFVLWAASAFTVGELAVIGTAAVALLFLWVRWERDHPLDDPADRENLFVPDEWLWPARIDDDRDDVSTVRHGGLGR